MDFSTKVFPCSHHSNSCCNLDSSTFKSDHNTAFCKIGKRKLIFPVPFLMYRVEFCCQKDIFQCLTTHLFLNFTSRVSSLIGSHISYKSENLLSTMEKKKQDKQNMLSAIIYFSFPFYTSNNSNVLYPCSPSRQDLGLCFHKLS